MIRVNSGSVSSWESKIYDSKFFDLLPHIVDAIEKAAFGVFGRLLKIPLKTGQLLAPLFFAKRTFSCRGILTHDGIEKNSLGIPENELLKEKFHWVIDRVESLAKKAGIRQEVQILLGNQKTNLASVSGNSISRLPIAVLIDLSFLQNSSYEEIEFTLAHEISHAARNHLFISCLVEVAILIVDVVVAIFFTPFAIPLVEFAAAPFERALERWQEKDADQRAVKLLRSTEGGIQFLSKVIEAHRSFRNSQKSKGIYYQLLISPEGNHRYDLHHPSFSRRIAYLAAGNRSN